MNNDSKNPFNKPKRAKEWVEECRGEDIKQEEVKKNTEKRDFRYTTIYFPESLKDRVDMYRRTKSLRGETKEKIVHSAIEEYLDSSPSLEERQEKNELYAQRSRSGKTMLVYLDLTLDNRLKDFRETGYAFETKNYIILAALDMWLTKRGV